MKRIILTEPEARTKICPVSSESCLASTCMMWSWSDCDPEVERKKLDHRATANESNIQKKFIPVKGSCSW